MDRRSTHKKRKALETTLALLLVALGLGVMLYPKLTDIRYEVSQWQLGRSAGALVDQGANGIVIPEGAVARLTIPAIGLDAFVVEGTGKGSLAKGPGHYAGTPIPGGPGNAAIAGHRTMYGHVFRDLDVLVPGDEIRTATARATAVYRVVELKVVDPSDTSVIGPSTDDRLTLTTCHPEGSAAKRLVVVAERID